MICAEVTKSYLYFDICGARDKSNFIKKAQQSILILLCLLALNLVAAIILHL